MKVVRPGWNAERSWVKRQSRVICGFITTLFTLREMIFFIAKIKIAVYSSWLLQRIVLQTFYVFKMKATQMNVSGFFKPLHQNLALERVWTFCPKFPSYILQSVKGVIWLPRSQTSSLVCCKLSECLSREVEPHYDMRRLSNPASVTLPVAGLLDYQPFAAALTSVGPFTMETPHRSPPTALHHRAAAASTGPGSVQSSPGTSKLTYCVLLKLTWGQSPGPIMTIRPCAWRSGFATMMWLAYLCRSLYPDECCSLEIDGVVIGLNSCVLYLQMLSALSYCVWLIQQIKA